MRTYPTNKPKSIFTFFKNLIKQELIYTSVTPTHALFIMTYRCTNKCKMCTIWKRGREIDIKNELSLDDWKKCFDMLGPDNLEVVELFGGDALIRKDVSIPLIEYITKRNNKIIVDFPTNSNLLDKKTAKDLVKAGVGRIYVSLDGTNEIHDNIRGNRGTYNHVQKAITYLVEAKKELSVNKPEIIVNCTISKSNVDNFEKIISIVEGFGVDTLEFEYVGEQETLREPFPLYTCKNCNTTLSLKSIILVPI